MLCDEKTARAHVRRLKRAAGVEFKAKDIFRASGLSLLGVSDTHVARDQRQIKAGHALSPLLLVRDTVHGRVIVADGYHRLCAVYSRDEDALVPCRIVYTRGPSDGKGPAALRILMKAVRRHRHPEQDLDPPLV